MFPRWLFWMFVAVMGYMVYVARPLPAPAGVPAQTRLDAAQYPALAALADGEHWKRRLDPAYAAAFDCSAPVVPEGQLALKIIEDAAGEGDPARCGETMHAAITVWNGRGGVAYRGDVALALGTGEVARGLDAALIGMRPDGLRTVVLPPAALARAPKSKAVPVALARALAKPVVTVVTVQRIQATPL